MVAWRSTGARLRRWRMRGLRMVTLENARLRVSMAVSRGGDTVEFVDKLHDVDYCFFDDDGPRPVVPGTGFLDSYRGGWQEVFPSGGTPSRYRGAELDQHAEVALLPWRLGILRDEQEEVRVELRARTTRLPFELVREVSLRVDAARIEVSARARNLAPVSLDAMWGQHIAFGPPFLHSGARLRVPDGVDELDDRGAVLARWPQLHVVPAVGSPSEMRYLSGFQEGWYELTAADGTHGIRVEWDAARMPYLWFWQELGASPDHPFWGRRHALGLEPFSSLPTAGLAEAVRNGSALRFDPYETKEFTWSAGPITPTPISTGG